MKIFFLFIMIFLSSCSSLQNKDNINSSTLNIYEDLTFDQFKEKFKIFTENSSYPDIKD